MDAKNETISRDFRREYKSLEGCRWGERERERERVRERERKEKRQGAKRDR